MKAYVLIKTQANMDVELVKQIQKLPKVIEVHRLFGIYDIIAEIDLRPDRLQCPTLHLPRGAEPHRFRGSGPHLALLAPVVGQVVGEGTVGIPHGLPTSAPSA